MKKIAILANIVLVIYVLSIAVGAVGTGKAAAIGGTVTLEDVATGEQVTYNSGYGYFEFSTDGSTVLSLAGAEEVKVKFDFMWDSDVELGGVWTRIDATTGEQAPRWGGYQLMRYDAAYNEYYGWLYITEDGKLAWWLVEEATADERIGDNVIWGNKKLDPDTWYTIEIVYKGEGGKDAYLYVDGEIVLFGEQNFDYVTCVATQSDNERTLHRLGMIGDGGADYAKGSYDGLGYYDNVEVIIDGTSAYKNTFESAEEQALLGLSDHTVKDEAGEIISAVVSKTAGIVDVASIHAAPETEAPTTDAPATDAPATDAPATGDDEPVTPPQTGDLSVVVVAIVVTLASATAVVLTKKRIG